MSKDKINEEFDQILKTKNYKNLAFWTLIVFFGGFLLWAAFVPLAEGVPTMGKVVVDTKRKAVQHSTGGTIKEIFVKEGDFVEKDQILIKLGDATALSEVLIEENNIKSIQENMSLQRISLTKLSNSIYSGNKQIKLVVEELEGIKSLVKEGYAPKIQQIELEKEYNRLDARNNEYQSTKEQTQQSIEELKFKLESAKESLLIAKRKLNRAAVMLNYSSSTQHT